jgi:uncharacterized protein (TIGR04255 family)
MVEVREILARPTVQTVITEFRFPHLLVIEQKLPDIQLALLERFPELRIQFEFNVLIGDPTRLAAPENLPPQVRQQVTEPTKYWEFDSKQGEVLRIKTNSISLSSTAHKTYNHGTGKRFRELVEFVSSRVFGIVKVPFFERVGLRYIDVCPFKKEDSDFRRWYAVKFPIDRYPLSTVEEMFLATRAKVGESSIFHQAAIRKTDQGDKFFLDYDAYQSGVASDKLLQTLDSLHDVIIVAFGEDITSDFLNYMRGN